jgi:hypothetical protein
LHVQEIEVDHAKVRAVHTTHLVYEFLEDVIRLRASGPQKLERRQPFYFASIIAGRCGVRPVSIIS